VKKHTERMAMLLSMHSFEDFYGEVMHLSRDQYLSSYRNDFSFMYAYALAELGVDVIIYLPSWVHRGLHRIEDRIFVRFLPISRWYEPWRRIQLLSKTPYLRYVSALANAKAFAGSLGKALLEDRINVLYVQEYWTARFDYLVKTVSVPVIGSDHGGKRRRQLTFFKKRAFCMASAITCQTQEECSDVRLFGGEPVLLTNGVDTSFYHPSDEVERRKTILIVARLTDRQKRISDLIRALQYVPEPWSLQIAGVGPDEEMLRALTEELGVGERVEFVGFVKDKAVIRDLYQRCGVYCMPSADEGLPLAVLEAMSCECSVVVTRIRAFEKLVQENETGTKVAVGQPKELAAAIAQAWDERERLGGAARRLVEDRYSLKTMAGRLLTLIHDSSQNKEDVAGMSRRGQESKAS